MKSPGQRLAPPRARMRRPPHPLRVEAGQHEDPPAARQSSLPAPYRFVAEWPAVSCSPFGGRAAPCRSAVGPRTGVHPRVDAPAAEALATFVAMIPASADSLLPRPGTFTRTDRCIAGPGGRFRLNISRLSACSSPPLSSNALNWSTRAPTTTTRSMSMTYRTALKVAAPRSRRQSRPG